MIARHSQSYWVRRLGEYQAAGPVVTSMCLQGCVARTATSIGEKLGPLISRVCDFLTLRLLPLVQSRQVVVRLSRRSRPP